MPYRLVYNQEQRTVLIDVYDSYDIPEDFDQSTIESIAILDAATEPHSVIYDYRKFEITLDLLMRATEYSRNMDIPDMTKHPMFAHNILVSESRLLHLSLNGFKKFGIGNKLSIVSDLEEAYALCKQA